MDNSNEEHDITHEVKNYKKKMSTETGLYTQVVKLRRKYLKFVATDKNKN